jgi:hypothetical protein
VVVVALLHTVWCGRKETELKFGHYMAGADLKVGQYTSYADHYRLLGGWWECA